MYVQKDCFWTPFSWALVTHHGAALQRQGKFRPVLVASEMQSSFRVVLKGIMKKTSMKNIIWQGIQLFFWGYGMIAELYFFGVKGLALKHDLSQREQHLKQHNIQHPP